MNTGELLKIAMLNRGVSNIELANRLNVLKQQVCNWRKSSSMSTKRLGKICKALNYIESEFVALGETKKIKSEEIKSDEHQLELI